MGVICPCGVFVEAFVENHKVKFICLPERITGNLAYSADICITSPETSTFTMTFTDTETPNENNFTFVAKTFSLIKCRKVGQNCEVTVRGIGIVNGRRFAFEAIFIDVAQQFGKDIIQKFVIGGFFDQNGALAVPQGSIKAEGCQEA
ncbi:hypothetical protein [Bacillus sp. FJAT-50079]|uniref:hypothetical protein n=1 Tax=Bacillus sp. FJAT-50079 TaxID=2833577 RepID=UPI001BC96CC2|nr:hypothetical protein [Bacillus sp. FJAT-50079]MBS4206956.1 hypothetical protein [Bacillus sp. FJAT-50079]